MDFFHSVKPHFIHSPLWEKRNSGLLKNSALPPSPCLISNKTLAGAFSMGPALAGCLDVADFLNCPLAPLFFRAFKKELVAIFLSGSGGVEKMHVASSHTAEPQ